MPVRRGGDDRGLFVVVSGPDGTGKSTFVDALIKAIHEQPIIRYHHRIGVLPRRAASLVAVDRPHATKPYPRWLSHIKVAYLFGDYLVGTFLRVRPALGRGTWVVLERGWWDLAVDPLRYRLSAGGSLAALLGRLLPRPDLLIVLEAPPETIIARKAELEREELERQASAWRRIARDEPRSLVLDSRRSVTDLVGETLAASGRPDAGTHRPAGRARDSVISTIPRPTERDRWVALPSPARARFILPASTRRTAFGGLAVYHPVTRRALIGWSIARGIARIGALRLLPSVEAPADLEVIREWYPSALVAISRSQRATRHTGLVLDRMGRPLGFVKVARDAAGTEKLAREVASIRELGALLPPPVSAPTHVRSAPGMLCFEAASWQPRFRPWELAPDVAAALGTLYRRGGGNGRRGPAHGDFAPWNLLRLTEGGWLLADWEDATADSRPFQDPFHWLVQSHALLGRPSRRALVEGVSGAGWIGRALDAYAAAADLEHVERREAFRAYLERTATALGSIGASHDREVHARLDLLAAISRPGVHPRSGDTP